MGCLAGLLLLLAAAKHQGAHVLLHNVVSVSQAHSFSGHLIELHSLTARWTDGMHLPAQGHAEQAQSPPCPGVEA